MSASKAWMVNQTGNMFPVHKHQYVIGDSDFESEAESASFILKSGGSDTNLCYSVIDLWIALSMYEYSDEESESDFDKQMRDVIEEISESWEYKFTVGEYIEIHNDLGNYNSFESMIKFIKSSDRIGMSNDISDSLNQQYMRVRYGGQYDTSVNSSEIWFRISSSGFNWYDVIYTILAELRRRLKITSVNICRDFESDNGFMSDSTDEYFYKAKDGSMYFEMPIDEFLSEEHGKNPVFESDGHSKFKGFFGILREEVIDNLRSGLTKHMIDNYYKSNGVRINIIHEIYNDIREKEIKCRCKELNGFHKGRK